jgi:uncharacterized protein (DUF1501 family)
MDPRAEARLELTRRRFFGLSARSLGATLGGLGLASLLSREAAARPAGGAGEARRGADGLCLPHHRPRARRVIYMHMEGAPSQLDLFDPKPGLAERFDQDLPSSFFGGQRLTGMTSGQARFPVAPSIFRFERHANRADGVELSELLPHTGRVARELCLVRSMHTDAINHEPAITFFQTGHQQPGRPSFGSWASYGLGSANEDLPAFVVLITQGLGNMQALSARFWGAGFLPGRYQGVQLRSAGSPVLYLDDPPGVEAGDRRAMLDLVAELNGREVERSFEPQVHTRLAQYEMAHRMQMSVPELTDFRDETPETLALYGPDVHQPGSFAANCLLARRLVERDVRFVQLYMRGWDQHGNLPGEIRAQCAAVDQGQAALVADLARRGLLEDTLVLWSGEFGRTVYCQGELSRENYGRDHHPRCFSLWLAGGGIQPGIVYGATDDFSYEIAEDPVSVHDLHATLLHLLGYDHTRLTFRHQGRDFRLTDVFGQVVPGLLS